ncbi:Extracellular dioxygenase [Phytophthora megakarya]|uniref:Extracellular dioxygenase n=1 Tax=Phytophthora megakarya TaxID=4795 RepID=A0A225VM57_9STRA|nr:Extracellular dioxygenase [Phytophthora megakarya]
MRDLQTGVMMYIDVQVIDVNTCEPVKDMYVDLWHANATGVYSGVVASTNGNSKDTSNLDNTFLRGVTPTDKDGVAQMISIFPGHYAGRTTHMHFIGNYGGTVLSNKTYSGGSVAHVGQFFFDQDLIASVEAVTPYSTNKQTVTLNKNDNIFKQASASGYDPVMNYTLLGDTVDDGVFVWISVAVDMTANRDVNAVSTLTAKTSTVTTTDINDALSISKVGGTVLLATFVPIILAIF